MAGLRIAVAGASGFVGRAAVEKLARAQTVIGLSRGQGLALPNLTWRPCDLLDYEATVAAVEGCDLAIYLVHSMAPQDRLVQGGFEDFDLLCADNFARACAVANISRIIYLGGLTPPTGTLSRHLNSRLEVEAALAAHGATVWALRAGLVIGPGGSSYQMAARLVARLPIMVLPKWTQTRTQPIDLATVVDLLTAMVERPDEVEQLISARAAAPTAIRLADGSRPGAVHAFDIGGPDVITYAELLRRIARMQGKQLRTLASPFWAPWLSRLWVSLFTGAPEALTVPLVESLSHEMVVTDGGGLQRALGLPGCPLDRALAIAEKPAPARQPATSNAPRRAGATSSTVRSLQVTALAGPAHAHAGPSASQVNAVAREYPKWMAATMRLFLRLEERTEGTERYAMYMRGLARPLLVLSAPDEASPLATMQVCGGLLVARDNNKRARLEFRTMLNGARLAACVHDFIPRLPWPLYRLTQAPIHRFITNAYLRHASKKATARNGT